MTSYRFGDIRSACASGANVTRMLSKLDEDIEAHVVLNYLYDHKNMPDVRWWSAHNSKFFVKIEDLYFMPKPYTTRLIPSFQVGDICVKFGRINSPQFAFRDAWYPLRVRLLKDVDDGFRFKDLVQIAVDKECYDDMRFIRSKMENDRGFFSDTRASRAATESDIINSRLLHATVAETISDIPKIIYNRHEREFVNKMLHGKHFQRD